MRLMTSGRPMIGLPERLEISFQPDVPALLFTGGTALLAAVIFGLAPAWNAFASGPALSLRARGRRRRLGNSLVVTQVALSVVLLSGAGMFAGRLSTLRNADLGFRRDRVLLVTLILRAARSEQLAGLYQDLLGRLEAIPGVLPATLCAVTPITGAGAEPVRDGGRPRGKGGFQTLGCP